MKRISTARHHQRGAVVILLGLSLLVVFGFMGLVIDLGRTYVVRTELQNAADAAALAGAKGLNQTAAGVCCGPNSAVTRAIGVASQNNFNFSRPVTITIADLSVGSCPDDKCMVPASSITSDAQAAGKTFLKADITSGALSTFFGAVAGVPTTSTYGTAVAGVFLIGITPIAICAKDPLTPGGRLPSGELTQYGFRRGMSYNLFDLQSGAGAPSNWYGLYPFPGACATVSQATLSSFLCSGNSAMITSPPPLTVWGTSQDGDLIHQNALNSRFDRYNDPGLNVCSPALGPPDRNIKEYPCIGSGTDCPSQPTPPPPLSPSTGLPREWMDLTPGSTPTRQTLKPPLNPVDAPPSDGNGYGVLWSYSRAVNAVGTAPNATVGAPFTPADWGKPPPPLSPLPPLYPFLPANALKASPTGYPGGSAGTTESPYGQASGSPFSQYFQAPSVLNGPGVADRRVLNLAIANCPAIKDWGNCQPVPVLAIGRFFMQTRTSGWNVMSGGSHLDLEFAGLIDPFPSSEEIKLYKNK